MYNRRRFIKIVIRFVSGMGLLLYVLITEIRAIFAKAKKIILPKGTRMDTLLGKNPTSMDTRDLDLTPVEEFETMGLDDHDVDLKKWQIDFLPTMPARKEYLWQNCSTWPTQVWM